MAVYSHSTIIAVIVTYSATTIFSIQSPHIRLMTLVARQLLPHLGQIYLRVLLGFFVLVSAPALLLPPLGSVPSTSSRLRLSTIWKSCQPCSSTKSRSSRPGLVIVQPYLGSIEEQNRITTILDRFDTLCNDLTKGLPAEIEARQKQYEYYRDKLLTFKELGA